MLTTVFVCVCIYVYREHVAGHKDCFTLPNTPAHPPPQTNTHVQNNESAAYDQCEQGHVQMDSADKCINVVAPL